MIIPMIIQLHLFLTTVGTVGTRYDDLRIFFLKKFPSNDRFVSSTNIQWLCKLPYESSQCALFTDLRVTMVCLDYTVDD